MATPKKKKRKLDPVPVDPAPCDLSDICPQIRDIITTIMNAPSGSLIMTSDDGHIQFVSNPAVNSTLMFNAATGAIYWNPS
jgi:hypothetical protein